MIQAENTENQNVSNIVIKSTSDTEKDEFFVLISELNSAADEVITESEELLISAQERIKATEIASGEKNK
jgi:hypothetical protein